MAPENLLEQENHDSIDPDRISFTRIARRLFAGATFLFLIVVFGFSFGQISRNHAKFQWDFKVYYYAGVAWQSGLNPYDPAVLSQLAHEPSLPFVYPPAFLPIFARFSRLPYPQAHTLFLALKLPFLLFLSGIWLRLLRTRGDGFFFLLLLAGFGSAVIEDFVTGNISLFEQLFLWTGFLLFIHRRPIGFAAGLLVAAFAKITPLFFLILLWPIPAARRVAGTCFTAFLLFHLGQVLLQHDLYRAFLAGIMKVRETGAGNPDLLTFFQDLIRLGSWPTATAILAYILTVIVFLRMFLPRLASLAHTDTSESRYQIILLASCLYIAILPRLKPYSFILLIPAAHSLFYRLAARTPVFKAGAGVFAIFVLTAGQGFRRWLPTITLPIPLLNDFQILGTAWLCFFLLLWLPKPFSAEPPPAHDRESAVSLPVSAT